MKITSTAKLPSKIQTLILPFQKGAIDARKIANFSGIGNEIDFEGNFKEMVVLYHSSNNLKIYLLGLGAEKDAPKAADAFRSLAFQQQKSWSKNVVVDLSELNVDFTYHAALGLQLAQYKIGTFKTEQKEVLSFGVKLIHPSKKAKKLAREGILTGETQSEMIRLVNSPGNEKIPRFIANYAIQSGKKFGFKVKVLGEKELLKEGLHAVLAVGKGSQHESVMIKLEYKPKTASKKTSVLGLVGKGITFDTGGLSIKGSMNMHYMKSDMGGAAAIIGAIELAAKLELPIHVIGIVPSAENAVDERSVKPGDVIPSYSGKTIEIIDTDAEGRLILADGLAYIQKNYDPDIVLDLATLTGSTVRTFGYETAGLFTKNEALAADLMAVGQATHERLWPLPMWDEYGADLHSDIADVKNFSGKPLAGAIFAGKFLEFFIKDHPKWAHLDIAGVAFGSSEYSKMKSATGYGVRLLVGYMRRLIG
ncbi:MAG: leucyl aminopeptidase family protein [Bacteroidota bacterium]